MLNFSDKRSLLLLTNNLHADTNYFNDGLELYKNKKYEMAKFKFEQDIVFNPKSEKSYLYLSKIFNYQKKIEIKEKKKILNFYKKKNYKK